MEQVNDMMRSENASCHCLEFRQCNVTVKSKGNRKRILSDVSASVKSGEFLAIIGPSGAGKTTLLNLLCLDSQPGEVSGSVLLDGEPLSLSLFRKHCAFVPQTDQLWPFLTCREMLECAVQLSGPGSCEENQARVEQLLEEMGLVSCANTRCGSQFFRGLSGGQKRRLSLAIALARKPQVLFLDEPTSGLDACASASVVESLHDLARRSGISIVCTIHQPSSVVFDHFDQLMVLSSGRVAFLGPAAQLSSHLASIGSPLPPHHNPAEFVLNMVNDDFSDPETVQRVIQEWEKRGNAGGGDEDLEMGPAERTFTALPSPAPPPLWQVMRVLLWRHLTLSWRDPVIYTSRMMLCLVTGVLFGALYWNVRTLEQEQVLFKVYLSMWVQGFPHVLCVIAVYSFNLELQSVLKEIREGQYSATAYFLTNSALQLPFVVAQSLLAMVGPYAVSNFYAPNFPGMLVIFASSLWAYENAAQLFALSSVNPVLGMLGFMAMWFHGLMFTGITLAESDVMWPFKALSFVFPERWGLASVILLEFRDTVWEGAELLPAEEDGGRGFHCPHVPAHLCFGRTGQQVLESLADSIPALGEPYSIELNEAVVVGMGLLFKLCAVALFLCRMYRVRIPLPSPSHGSTPASSSTHVRSGIAFAGQNVAA